MEDTQQSRLTKKIENLMGEHPLAVLKKKEGGGGFGVDSPGVSGKSGFSI